MHPSSNDQNAQIGVLVGRILIASFFIIFGIMKVMQFTGQKAYAASVFGSELAAIAIVVAILVELGGGLGLALGYKTRLSAWALAIFSLVTAFFFHTDFSDPTQTALFMKNIAITGGLMFVIVHGAGSMSLDAKQERTQKAQQQQMEEGMREPAQEQE